MSNEKHEHPVYPIPGRSTCVVCLQLQVEKLRKVLEWAHEHLGNTSLSAQCLGPDFCVVAQALADIKDKNG